jgi:medium-chain acyl-[acyl-carrier-protein] hydrolase
MIELMQFEKEYAVHVYETGPDGILSIHALFNYLQDIASDHAIILGFGREALMRESRFWVLSRIYAEITQMPKWEDRIVITTWPNGTDKLFALRNFEVCYKDGRHIASATSSWLILDRITKKIQRPDTILSKFYSDLHPNQSLLRYASKLDFHVDDSDISDLYKIKVSDLDINLHVNNVRYLTWVSDTYTLDFVLNNVPKSAEINYLAESQSGDVVIIKTMADQADNSIIGHSVIRMNDNKELCRIRIGWKGLDNK